MILSGESLRRTESTRVLPVNLHPGSALRRMRAAETTFILWRVAELQASDSPFRDK